MPTVPEVRMLAETSRSPIAVAMLVAASLSLTPTRTRADAIGIPSCPIGTHGVSNAGHGIGWCEASPCEADADCTGGLTGPIAELAAPAGAHCRVIGVCYSGDRAAQSGSCTVDSARCVTAPWEAGESTCRVRGHCVPADRAAGLPMPPGAAGEGEPVPPPSEPAPPPVAPLETPAVAPTPAAAPAAPVPATAPTWSCACRAIAASHARQRLTRLTLVLVIAVGVARRARRRVERDVRWRRCRSRRRAST